MQNLEQAGIVVVVLAAFKLVEVIVVVWKKQSSSGEKCVTPLPECAEKLGELHEGMKNMNFRLNEIFRVASETREQAYKTNGTVIKHEAEISMLKQKIEGAKK